MEVSVGTDFNEEWADCELKEEKAEETISRGPVLTLPPRTTAEVRVYQNKANLAFNYTADLSFGEPGVAQPLVSPVPRALGMSPARSHPCAGYIAGDARLDLSKS